jgi:hypothetical protein
MDPRTAAIGCAVVGLWLVTTTGVVLTPPADRQILVTYVDGINRDDLFKFF